MAIYFVIYKSDLPINRTGVKFPYINNHVHLHFFCHKYDAIYLPKQTETFRYMTHTCMSWQDPYNEAKDFYETFKNLGEHPLMRGNKYIRLKAFKPTKPKKVQSTDTLGELLDGFCSLFG